MRQRALKPGFFDNPELAECGIESMMLFAGLWCYSDREGRCKDEPARIRAHVFPYFPNIDVAPLLALLITAGFIVRYEVAGVSYLWCPTFTDHQHPHPRESESVIPPCPMQGQDEDIPRTDLGVSKAGGARSTEYGVSEHGEERDSAPLVTSKEPPHYSALPECFSKFPTTKFDGVPIPDCIPQIVNRRFGMISPAKYGQFCAALTEGCLPACDGNKKQCLWCVEHVDYKVTNKPWKLLLMAMRSDREVVPPDARRR